jgi:hypothetical protein
VAFAAADRDDAAAAAIDTVLRMTEELVDVVVRRKPLTDENGRHAVLYPAIAESARRAAANAVGLVDVGCSAGLNLNVDRGGMTYSDGQSLGDPTSPVQLSWERMARLEAELALATAAPPLLLQGDVVERLPAAFARVPADALPVVTTTWALSRLQLEARLRFLHRLDEEAARRPVGWVSAEGVGVAPAIPTLGDWQASGHSIIGLAVLSAPSSTSSHGPSPSHG